MPDERNEQDEQPTIRKFPGDNEYTEPPLSDGDTEDYVPSDDDVPFKLPSADSNIEYTQDNRDATHKQVTMPIFREPGVPDPKMTLPGSGGLDPNPDMADFGNEYTLPHPASMATVQHQPAVPYQPPYQPPAHPPQPDAGYTMPNPAVAEDHRYQRPGLSPQVQMAQGHYVPPPPSAQAQKQLPRRRTRAKILGLNAGCVWIFLGLFVTLCGGMTLFTGVAAAIFIPRIEAQWEGVISGIDTYKAFESTFLYDRHGNVLYEVFGEGRRVVVSYDRFPKALVDATIAIEDDSFWDNIGVDVPATTVALLNYLGAAEGERTPGGSTITQQVVRNVLFDYEKRSTVSAQRKAEEILLAILLTNRRSKEDIVAMYLNEIYYGNLAYGAQTAAQTLFSKNVENLTLGEAALIAGLPQAPADLDPLNPDPAVQEAVYNRQRQVLSEMLDEGYITQHQHDQALAEGLTFSTPQVNLNAPHFTVYAQGELERLMTELGYSASDIARGGLRVYTTVDQTVNALAQQAASEQVDNLARQSVSNAAVLVLKPLTGEILGMVGSIDYNSPTIDGRVNVTIALRQPGSTMKPFTYSAALERGMTPGDVIWDTKTDIGIPGQPTYTPRNYDGAFHGPMTIRTALANSYNIPAVQTLRVVGVDYLLELMRRFGVDSLNQDASQYGLSLTLGGGDMSLVELTAGYSVFANQGVYVQPTSILCIVDSDDEVLYQYENGCPAEVGRISETTVNRSGFGKQVLDPRIAYLITDILSDNQSRSTAMGANSPLRTDGIQTSVKTGTTNDVKDNWTVGYTRNVAVGVWVGNNDNTPMVGSSGLTGAAPIWNRVMTSIYQSPEMLQSFVVGGQFLPDKPEPPAGMSLRQICDVRRISDPSADCPSLINEWFLDGPAGIPDGGGNLQYPPQVDYAAPQQGGYVESYSPGVYRALVVPLPDYVAAGIQFQLNPGDKAPPAPKYCRVTPELASQAVGAQDLIFIAPPSTSQGDLVEAENYARQRNLAILPTIDCWGELLNAAPPPVQEPQFGAPITTAVITSPANGETVSGNIPIIGTAQLDNVAEFYHIYIMGGPFPNWTALGSAGYQSVYNGQLEILQAEALPPGQYGLRLALVKDGGFIQDPYDITFTKP